MDLKKEFLHRNIKEEAESESYNSETFTTTTNNVLQIKFEDSTERDDQIENALEAIVNAGQSDEPLQVKECKTLPIAKNIEPLPKSFDRQICRLCARTITGNEIFLYQDRDLEQKINYALPITAGLGDGLPEYICGGCESNLNLLYDFVCQVVTADKTIKERLSVPDVKNGDVTNATIKQIFGTDPSELVQENEFAEASSLDISTTKELQEKKPSKRSLNEDDDFEKLQKIPKLQQDNQQEEETKSEHRYKCQHCNENFPDYFAFIHHNKQSHQIVHYPCPEIGCLESFATEKSLREHIKDNHNVPVICYKCGKIFAYQKALLKHEANMHFVKVCNDCGMSFKCSASYKTHQTLHTEVAENQCVYCYKGFKNRHHLHRHTRQKHSGNFTLLLDSEEDEARK